MDDPFRLADAVLPGLVRGAAEEADRQGRAHDPPPHKLPVHLAYFTAYVDDVGGLRTLPDIYGYDAPMRAALGLPGGGGPAMARAPVEPKRGAEAEGTRGAAPARGGQHRGGPPGRIAGDRALAAGDTEQWGPRRRVTVPPCRQSRRIPQAQPEDTRASGGARTGGSTAPG